MSKEVSFLNGVKLVGWFKRIFKKCYSKQDVIALDEKYQAEIKRLEDSFDKELKDAKTALENCKKEHEKCISDLTEKHNESNATSGRIAGNREGTITGLKNEINTLKQQKKDLIKEHADTVHALKEDFKKQKQNFAKTGADEILKEDKDKKKKETTRQKNPNSKAGKNPGSKSGKCSLTEEQVVEIYKRGNNGEDRKELEKEFKSNKTTVGRIITGKAYKKWTKKIKLEDTK